jgi:hypothetical protein
MMISTLGYNGFDMCNKHVRFLHLQTLTQSFQLHPLSVMYEWINLNIPFPIVYTRKGLHISICYSAWLLYMYLTNTSKTERPATSVHSSSYIAKPSLFSLINYSNSHLMLHLISLNLLDTVEFERGTFSIAFSYLSASTQETVSLMHSLPRLLAVMCASLQQAMW